MNKQYDKTKVMKLLDADTMKALFRIYGIEYSYLAGKFSCTRPNIFYHMKFDSWKVYQREAILDILLQRGLEIAELVIINQLVKKKVKQ